MVQTQRSVREVGYVPENREEWNAACEELYPLGIAIALRFTRNPETAEDITQTALMRTWRMSSRLDGQRPLSSYFARVVRNGCTDFYRQTSRSDKTHHELHAMNLSRQHNNEIPQAELHMHCAEMWTKMQRAIDALPDIHRGVLLERVLGRSSYQEIADIFEVSIGTVRSRINRAKQQLQRALQ